MFSLRTHAVICAALFVAMIGLAAAGNALQAAGYIPPAGAGPVMIVIFFALVIGFAFSFVPVMVKTVFAAQRKVGNAGREPVKSLMQVETIIIWAMWTIMALGLAIAIPGAILLGAFDSIGTPASAARAQPAEAGALRTLGAQEEAACRASGGIVSTRGRTTDQKVCVRSFPDRGKTCRDSDECFGECRFVDDSHFSPSPFSPDHSQQHAPALNEKPVGSRVEGQCQWSDWRWGCRSTVEDGMLQEWMCAD